MKFLGGLDRLRIMGAAGPDGVRLNGTVAWATNMRRQGFVAAIAVGDEHADNPSVYALPYDARGVTREPDLDLLALRGTNTAALRLDDVALDASWQIHPQARVFLPGIRPAFVGLQCGLGLGLARASLGAARTALDSKPSILSGEIDALDADIAAYRQTLCTGLDVGSLRERPRDLLTMRLRMVKVAAAAVALELQAVGGACLAARGERRLCPPCARSGVPCGRYADGCAVEERARQVGVIHTIHKRCLYEIIFLPEWINTR
jgi:hypothetical protein